MNYRKQIALWLLLAILCSAMFVGCSSAQDSFDHTQPDDNTYSYYYFDVFTSASKDNWRNGVIELQDCNEDIYFQVENVGKKRQFAVQIFMDCRLTPIIIDGIEYETFIIDADEEMSNIYSFRLAEPLDTSMNHSMLAILIAGSDIYTNQVEFDLTDQYSIALDHILLFGEDLPMAQADYDYEKTELVTEYQSTGLLLNTDIENHTRAVPEREIIVQQGEEVSLQYQVGGFEDCKEVAVIITVGLKQAKINSQDYILCKVNDGDLVRGVVNLNAPVKAGSYEIMGWVVEEPFDTDKSEYVPSRASIRFALTVQ